MGEAENRGCERRGYYILFGKKIMNISLFYTIYSFLNCKQ